MTDRANSSSLSARIIHGRAVNSVADFLRRTLMVPEIYLEPKLGSGSTLDVLAVDRAGAGDYHVVELKIAKASAAAVAMNFKTAIAKLKAFPAHFKYLALPASPPITRLYSNDPELFADDGIGRIGLLLVEMRGAEPPLIEMIAKPERFRVPASKLLRIERFVAQSHPDIYVRV